MALSFQELAHQPQGRPFVAAALDQEIEHEARLVDSAPKPVFATADQDHDLIKMPFVAKSSCRSAKDRTLWCETTIPRSASRSSTIRRLSGKRK